MVGRVVTVAEVHGAARARACARLNARVAPPYRVVVAGDARAVAVVDRATHTLELLTGELAAIAELLAWLAADGVREAVLRDHDDSGAHHALLVAAGFAPIAETVVVRRELAALPPARHAWTLRAVATDALERAIADALAGSASRYARRATLVEPDAAYRARWWRVAELDGAQVGVVLPRPLGEHGVTMSLIGLAPAWRGRGLAADLLVHALAALAAAGARTYVDETDRTDLAAQRLFDRAGCRPIALRRLYRNQPHEEI